MKIIKKIGHWITFLIGGYIGTWLILSISTLIPLFVFYWLVDFSDFWFFMIGGIIVTLYYIIIFGGLSLFFTFLNKKKPDYWVSNIFIALTTVLFFYTIINSFGKIIGKEFRQYLTFKGIVFLITIIPAYFQILYFTIIAQFIKEDWNR